MATEESIRKEVRSILKTADSSTTPRNVREKVAEKLQIDDINAWRDVIKDELRPYLPDSKTAGSGSPQGSKRKLEEALEDEAEPQAEPKAARISTPAGAYALSEDRFVKVSEFNGRKLIDVREYYEKNGESLPGSKGLALSTIQWQKLSEKFADISNAAKEEDTDFSLDLGNNRFASVTQYKGSININLREFFEKDGELAPGKKGIALSLEQWQSLQGHAKDLDAQLAAAKQADATPTKKAAETPNKDNAASAKKDNLASAKKDNIASGSEEFVELGNSRRMSVSEFKGRVYLNLREYYEKNGEMRPGKKGISLNKEQAEKLRDGSDRLTQALENKSQFTVDLGNRRKASFSEFKGNYSIDIREYYEKDGEEQPGTKGLSLKSDQWQTVKQNLAASIGRM